LIADDSADRATRGRSNYGSALLLAHPSATTNHQSSRTYKRAECARRSDHFHFYSC
jgi:hypothetical protein